MTVFGMGLLSTIIGIILATLFPQSRNLTTVGIIWAFTSSRE